VRGEKTKKEEGETEKEGENKKKRVGKQNARWNIVSPATK
jgi:hypothetical protein